MLILICIIVCLLLIACFGGLIAGLGIAIFNGIKKMNENSKRRK